MLRPSPSSTRAAATTPAEPVGARVARFPTAGSLPRISGGSASASLRFEACTAFNVVAARVVAEPPKAVLWRRSASADVVASIVRSDCYRLERQLPGGIRTRWGMAPCHGAPRSYAKRVPAPRRGLPGRARTPARTMRASDPAFRVDQRVGAEPLDRRRGRQDGSRTPAGSRRTCGPGVRHLRGASRVRAGADPRTHRGRAQGRTGPWSQGREEVRAVAKAQVRLAQVAMAHRDTSVSALCRELGIRPVNALPVRRPAGPAARAGPRRSSPPESEDRDAGRA